LANDQLRIEKNKGNAFNTFSEAPITFRPTYKFDVYTKNYISNEASDYSSFTDTHLNRTNYNRIADSITTTTNPTIEDISSNGSNKMETNHTKMNNDNNININDDEDDDDDYNNNNNYNNYNYKLLKYENSKENIIPPPNYEMEHPVKEITTLSKLNVYDTSKKARIPSWTDRILFRVRHQKPLTPISLDNDNNPDHKKPSINQYTNMNAIRIPLKPVLVEKYTSCENMYWSDHKPVIGSFRIDNDWSSDDTINSKKVIHRKTNKNACIIQ